MKWRHLVPVGITVLGLLTACASIRLSIIGLMHDDPTAFDLAALSILATLLLDGLDGNVARWIGGCSVFGADLDTYVDFTGFALAPALLVYAQWPSCLSAIPNWLIPALIVLMGAFRLSRFRTGDPSRGLHAFTGLPLSMNASFIALWTLINQREAVLASLPVLWIVCLLCILLMLGLQVSTVRYPPAVKAPGTYVCGVAALGLLGVVYGVAPKYTPYWALILLIIGCVYVLIVPWFMQTRESSSSHISSP